MLYWLVSWPAELLLCFNQAGQNRCDFWGQIGHFKLNYWRLKSSETRKKSEKKLLQMDNSYIPRFKSFWLYYVSIVTYFPSPEIDTLTWPSKRPISMKGEPFSANAVAIEISGEAITWRSLCCKDTHLKQSWHTHIKCFDPHTGASKCKKRPGQLGLKGNYTWTALVCT